jgi:hypothetical protein
LARPSTGTFAVMLIAESQSTFRDFLAQRDKDPTRLLPEELLTLGYEVEGGAAVHSNRCPGVETARNE